MNFGFMAPTVAGLQEEPGCKTSGVADSALKASNGKPCLTRSGSRADVRCEASPTALSTGAGIRFMPHQETTRLDTVTPSAVKCRVVLCDPLNGHEIPRQWPAVVSMTTRRGGFPSRTAVRKRWVRHNLKVRWLK